MKTVISHSVAETEKIAQVWLAEMVATPANDSQAVVVGLYGNLGSGKTTFTQDVARALGIKETITSPTFVIMKRYEINGSRFKYLVHIDAYRLEKSADFDALNLKDTMNDPYNLILIEWAENVEDALPSNMQKIGFEYLNETDRKLYFDLCFIFFTEQIRQHLA